MLNAIDHPTPEIVAEIAAHNEKVACRGSDRTCYREFCGRCQAVNSFNPHDVRCRGLRVVTENTVVCEKVWLARWRCSNCGYKFTDYPDFRTSVQALRLPEPS